MASPGLTAACAIGYHVIDWLNTKERFVKKKLSRNKKESSLQRFKF